KEIQPLPTAGQNTKHTVELRADGWFPQELTLEKGDTVTFTTAGDKFFWPASNIHPTHSIYPEFDPKKPIPVGESWSFTFNKPGTWRFHDHIQASNIGEIIVLGNGQESANENCRDLEKLESQQREQCWDALLSDALKKKGVAAAFSVFTDLYQRDPLFSFTGCHWYAHRIGEEFYAQEYPAYEDNIESFKFPAETYYCGFGFFHGWLEHMLRDDLDVKKAKLICEYLDNQLSHVRPRIRLNCYHAIGHGFINEPYDPLLWGKPQEIIDPALKVCGSVSNNPNEVRECLQGAFNVLADWTFRKEYGLFPPAKDPLMLCHAQGTDEHKQACYYEMAMHLNSLVGDDLVKLAEFAKDIKDDQSAWTVIDVVAAGATQRALGKDDYSEYIHACHSVPERLRLGCIHGFAGGFMAHGEPEKEYIEALKFCDSEELLEDERHVCYKNIIRTFKGSYPREKVEDICLTIDEEYQPYCLYEP
ncbi:MAG: hypothetical protein O3C23_00630, partial [bacterium]|nr:hypothetical protein [bacterium]